MPEEAGSGQLGGTTILGVIRGGQERQPVDQGAILYTIKPVYLFWAE